MVLDDLECVPDDVVAVVLAERPEGIADRGREAFAGGGRQRDEGDHGEADGGDGEHRRDLARDAQQPHRERERERERKGQDRAPGARRCRDRDEGRRQRGRRQAPLRPADRGEQEDERGHAEQPRGADRVVAGEPPALVRGMGHREQRDRDGDDDDPHEEAPEVVKALEQEERARRWPAWSPSGTSSPSRRHRRAPGSRSGSPPG